ncbi:MAG: hypothetical protein WCR56_06560 [Bacilli bacterium]|jgi:hypothetical protein
MCDVYNYLTSALTYGGGGSNSLLGYDYIESVYLYTDDDNNIVGYGQVNTVTFSSTGMRFQTNLYADIENYGTTVVDKDSVLANYPTFTTSEALKTRY